MDTTPCSWFLRYIVGLVAVFILAVTLLVSRRAHTTTLHTSRTLGHPTASHGPLQTFSYRWLLLTLCVAVLVGCVAGELREVLLPPQPQGRHGGVSSAPPPPPPSD